MSLPRVKYRTSVGALGYGIVLVISLGLLAQVQAQETSPLLPVKDPPVEQNEILELQQRVRELETIVAESQSGMVDGLASPFSTDVPRIQDSTHVQSPTRLASFVEPLLGRNYAIDIGGYVKADLIHDFNAIGSTDVFDPITIPTDGRGGENTRLHARQTRFNLDYRPHRGCDDQRLFVETDFFGTTEPFRRGRAFLRLRHAFVRAGRLLAGQTWSTFMDESILPNTLDFESARSVILDRRALFRWTQPVTESLDLAFAVEDPRQFLDLDVAPAGDDERPAPDLIARARYEAEHGHLQAAGLVRMIRFREALGTTHDAAGWGFNFTGRRSLREFDSVLFQVAFGEGIESYRQGVDGAVAPNGKIELIPVLAWVVGYEVDWSERFSSAFVYSYADGDNAAFQADTAAKSLEYLAANLIFQPRPRLSYGIEYLYGTRTDKNDAKGAAHRLQMSVQYDLP